MKITTAPLSREDIKLLKSENPMRYFIILFLMLLASLMFYNIYYGEPDSPKQVYDWDDILIMIFGVLFIGFLFFYLVYSIIKTQKDIASGQKEVLIGTLTDKNSYYFYIDNEKIAVLTVRSQMRRNGGYYDNIGEIGQIIAIERSIYAKNILKVEVLNELEKTQKIAVFLSQEDIKNIKQETKTSYILISVLTIIFFLALYFACTLPSSQSKRDSNFASPVVAIMVSLLTGGIVMYLLYANAQTQKDLKSGQKEVLTGILTDKKEIWDKTISSKYFYIDEEEIKLDNAIAISAYYKAEIGQKIVIQRSIKSKTILKIDVLNETE